MESTDFKAICEKVSESSKINPNINKTTIKRHLTSNEVFEFNSVSPLEVAVSRSQLQ